MIRRKERERAPQNASFLLEFYRGTNIQKSITLFSFIVSTIIKNLSKSTFKPNSKEEKDFNLTRLHFTLVFELNLVCCARTYFSFAEIYNKNSKIPLLRYHFKCCRHPCTKAKIPQPVGCDIANPKRSENHLANW